MAEQDGNGGRGIDVEAYYLRYAPMVLRRCRRLLGNEQAAYDAMQEVFVKLMSHRARLRDAYPSALLYRMATNTCLNMIRDDRRDRFERRDADDILLNMPFFESPDRAAVAKLVFEYALNGQPETTRRIAVLYFLDGLTLKETGDEVGLSIAGVHRHLEKLRRRLRDQGGSA